MRVISVRVTRGLTTTVGDDDDGGVVGSFACARAGNLRDDAASARVRGEDSSIAPEIIAHDVRFERKLRTRAETRLKNTDPSAAPRSSRGEPASVTTPLCSPSIVSWHPVSAYRTPVIAINGNYFQGNRYLITSSLKKLVWYVFARLFSMENYDTMQMSARRCAAEKVRDRDYRQNCIFRARISLSKHGNYSQRDNAEQNSSRNL